MNWETKPLQNHRHSQRQQQQQRRRLHQVMLRHTLLVRSLRLSGGNRCSVALNRCHVAHHARYATSSSVLATKSSETNTKKDAIASSNTNEMNSTKLEEEKKKHSLSSLSSSSSSLSSSSSSIFDNANANDNDNGATTSTSTSTNPVDVDIDVAALSRPRIKVHFNSVVYAFRAKSSMELLRSLLVFRLCGIPWLVQNSNYLVETSYSVLGKKITNWMLQRTFFGHFCGGIDAKDIQQVVDKLAVSGMGSVLDYAAEADVEQSRDLNGVDKSKISARTYDYSGEAQCDANAEISMQCIEAASNSKDGFAAIKCTALGKPELLQQMSSILLDTAALFESLNSPDLSRKKVASVDRSIDFETLKVGMNNSGMALNDQDIRILFDKIDVDNSGKIDYLDWLSFVNPIDLTMGELTQFLRHEKLTNNEIQQMANMIGRLERLASFAAEKGVKLMIDAEQTYMQPAIDHLVLNLQRKYNRNGVPVIFNTFQCYLKDSHDRLLVDLKRSKQENFFFACKLVRGAYMVQERKRAMDKGYVCPIHNTIQDTHDNYDKMIQLLLENNDNCSFMVASHNKNSVMLTVNQMEKLNIPITGGGVFFGQLLGMCDHVSYSLGHAGYQVYKYLPYGPIEQVVPYLIRRAEENSDIMTGAKTDIDLLLKELKRRHWFGKFSKRNSSDAS